MIYVMHGSEPYFIQEKINDLIKSSNAEVIKLNGNDNVFSVDYMIDCCNGNSLLNDKTCVLVKDPQFLIKKSDDKTIESIINYVSQPLYETDLILYTFENNFNTRLNAYKNICDNARVFKLDSLDYKNFNSYCYARLNEIGLELNKDLVYQLISMCKRNASLFNTNIEILKLYPNKIDTEVISKLCTSSDLNNIYEMIDAITLSDQSKAIFLFRKLINENESVLGIIALLSNTLRMTYTVGYMQDDNISRKDIYDMIGGKPFVVDKCFDILKKTKKEKILKFLNDLSIIDCQIKSDTTIDDKYRFEMFILKTLKKD